MLFGEATVYCGSGRARLLLRNWLMLTECRETAQKHAAHVQMTPLSGPR